MIDLPITIHVTLTREAIDSGYPGDGERCPIARALQSEYPDWNIDVGGTFVTFGSKYEDIEPENYTLPGDAKMFIKNFDEFSCGIGSGFMRGSSVYEASVNEWRNTFMPFEFDIEAEVF